MYIPTCTSQAVGHLKRKKDKKLQFPDLTLTGHFSMLGYFMDHSRNTVSYKALESKHLEAFIKNRCTIST